MKNVIIEYDGPPFSRAWFCSYLTFWEPTNHNIVLEQESANDTKSD